MPKTTPTISINTAAATGVERLRLAKWSNPLDHIKVDIIDGKPGPWLHLYCPSNVAINGRDPQDMLFTLFNLDVSDWLPYLGPVPTSDEYKADAARFTGGPN